MRRILGLVAAATLASAAPALAQKDTLIVGVANFTDSISPAGGAYFTLSLAYQTWEPLVARDADDKLEPALAERWESIGPTH